MNIRKILYNVIEAKVNWNRLTKIIKFFIIFVITGLILIFLVWIYSSISNEVIDFVLKEWNQLQLKWKLLTILTPVLIFILGWLWWRQRDAIYIFPFQNHTGEESYNGMVTGFADLLIYEYERAVSLRDIMDVTYGREFGEPTWLSTARSEGNQPRTSFSYRRDSGMKRRVGPSIMPMRGTTPKCHFKGLNERGNLGVALKQVGEIKLGPIRLPIESLFYLTLRVLGQGQISGNFQKHGSVLTIIVNWEGPDGGNWQIRSNALPKSIIQDDQLHEMARHLAHMQIWKITNTSENDPLCIQEWISGLDHFWGFRCSGGTDIKQLKDAEKDLKRAIELNPSFYLAHLHLGIVLYEQDVISAAIKQFEEAIELERDNPQAHYMLSLSYLSLGWLYESLRECQKAVDLKSDFFAARHLLANLKKEVGDEHVFISKWVKQENRKQELEKAASLYGEAMNEYKQIIKDYETRTIAKETRIATKEKSMVEIARAKGGLGNVYTKLALIYKDEISKQKENFLQAERAFKEAFELYQELQLCTWSHEVDSSKCLDSKCLDLSIRDKVAIKNLIEGMWIKPDSLAIKRDLGNLFVNWSEKTLESSKWKNDNKIRRNVAVNLKVSIEAFKDVLKNDPMNWEIWKKLAFAYLMLGQLKAACRYDKLDDKPSDCKGAEEEFNNAIAFLGKAMALNPKDYKAYDRLARVYNEKKEYSMAEAYKNIAKIIWASCRDGRKALKQLEKISSSLNEKERSVYLLTRGWLSMQYGNRASSLNCLENANINQFQEAKYTQLELGILYLSEGKWDSAFMMERFIKENEIGRPLQLLLDLADAYYLRKKYKEVIDICDEIIRRSKKDVDIKAEALAKRAQANLANKEYYNAIYDCKKAATLLPTYDFPWYILGFIYQEMLDYDAAIHTWNKLMEFKSKQLIAHSHHQIANAYSSKALSCDDEVHQKELLLKAIEEYKNAFRSYGARDLRYRAIAHADMAQALVGLGRYREASLDCEKALAFANASLGSDKEPLGPDFHLHLAYIFADCKQFARAKQEFEDAIKLCEEESDKETSAMYAELRANAFNGLAYELYAQQGINLEEGLRLVDKAIKIMEDLSNDLSAEEMEKKKDKLSVYLITKAWLHYRKREYDEALKSLEKATSYLIIAMQEEHYLLALIYEGKAKASKGYEERKYNTEQARIQWKQVIDLNANGKWGKIASQRLNGKREVNDL